MIQYFATCLIFYLFLCGGIFAAAWTRRPFGKAVPFILFLSVVVVFAFAAVGQLYVGGTVVLLLGLCTFVLGAAALVRNRFQGWSEILTPAWLVFTVFFVVICVCNYERRIWYADDFRHWATVVKAMVQQNILGSDAAARLTHSNYPPAMAIVQYLVQRMLLVVSPQAEFCDALLYVAGESAIIVLFLPFLPQRFMQKRAVLQVFVCLFAVLTVALAFSPLVLSVVMIDGFLGLLFGCGAAMLVRGDAAEHDGRWLFCLLLAVLTLTKNTGVLFAGTLAVLYVILPYLGKKQRITAAIGATVSVAVPYLLWQHLLAVGGGVQKFSDPIPLDGVFALLRGQADAFQRQVCSLYFEKLLKAPLQQGELGVPLTFVAVMLLFATAFSLLTLSRRRKDPIVSARTAVVSAGMWCLTIAYALCMPILYLFLFSEMEAQTVIMWDRYLSIPCSGMLFLLAAQVLDGEIFAPRKKRLAAILLLAVLFVIMPWREPVRFLTGYATRQSQQLYATYAAAVNSAREGMETPSECRVLIVMQSTEISGQDGEGIRYNLRPAVSDLVTFSDDYRCLDQVEAMTEAAAFQQYLLQREYDYVLLYRLDDDFTQNYAAAFADPSRIAPNTLLHVDPVTGQLQ